MHFNDHSRLQGQHAFLAASKYHWLNYDSEKLARTWQHRTRSIRGSELHQLAYDLIRLGVRLPRTQTTLNAYVNDAIGYGMKPEQVLCYSDNAFGTADTIGFKNGVLRIHDLKTGVTPASMKQLEVYAAFFCLEYRYNPEELDIQLRIYQNDEVISHRPDPEVIKFIMEKVKAFDSQITRMRMEE